MGKCLVTTLQGEVNNKDIPVYGTIDLDIDLTNHSGDFTHAIVSNGGSTTVEVLDYNTGEVLIQKAVIWDALPVAQWNTLIGKRIIYRIHNRYGNIVDLTLDGYIEASDTTFRLSYKDFSYCGSLSNIFMLPAPSIRSRINITGELDDILKYKSAATIKKITACDWYDTFKGRYDAFITDLENDTPTLLLPQLNVLKLRGHFTLPDGYTKSQLAQKYRDAGVTTVEFD